MGSEVMAVAPAQMGASKAEYLHDFDGGPLEVPPAVAARFENRLGLSAPATTPTCPIRGTG
jgi:hypothetical protein